MLQVTGAENTCKDKRVPAKCVREQEVWIEQSRRKSGGQSGHGEVSSGRKSSGFSAE